MYPGVAKPKPSKGSRGSISHLVGNNTAICLQVSNLLFSIVIIAIISWIRLQEEEERAGFRDEDSNFEREPYRAAETAAHIDNGLRRRVYGQYAGNGMAVPGQVLTSTGYTTGVPNAVYPAPAPIYQQPGQPLVVQGGQVVNGAYY